MNNNGQESGKNLIKSALLKDKPIQLKLLSKTSCGENFQYKPIVYSKKPPEIITNKVTHYPIVPERQHDELRIRLNQLNKKFTKIKNIKHKYKNINTKLVSEENDEFVVESLDEIYNRPRGNRSKIPKINKSLQEKKQESGIVFESNITKLHKQRKLLESRVLQGKEITSKIMQAYQRKDTYGDLAQTNELFFSTNTENVKETLSSNVTTAIETHATKQRLKTYEGDKSESNFYDSNLSYNNTKYVNTTGNHHSHNLNTNDNYSIKVLPTVPNVNSNSSTRVKFLKQEFNHNNSTRSVNDPIKIQYTTAPDLLDEIEEELFQNHLREEKIEEKKKGESSKSQFKFANIFKKKMASGRINQLNTNESLVEDLTANAQNKIIYTLSNTDNEKSIFEQNRYKTTTDVKKPPSEKDRIMKDYASAYRKMICKIEKQAIKHLNAQIFNPEEIIKIFKDKKDAEIEVLKRKFAYKKPLSIAVNRPEYKARGTAYGRFKSLMS